MVKLPDIDARFLELGEVRILIDYATEMADLLRHRWSQREIRLRQGYLRDEIPEHEIDMDMQAEQHQQEMYEHLLGAQVLLTAWAMLEGSVQYCTTYLAEQKSIKKSLQDPGKWPAQFQPAVNAPVEEKWRTFYVNILGMSYPLEDDLASIAAMRKLRNSLGHALHFDHLEMPKRRQLHHGPISDDAIELYATVELPLFDDAYLGRKYAELTADLVEKLRVHAQAAYPVTEPGIHFWDRRK